MTNKLEPLSLIRDSGAEWKAVGMSIARSSIFPGITLNYNFVCLGIRGICCGPDRLIAQNGIFSEAASLSASRVEPNGKVDCLRDQNDRPIGADMRLTLFQNCPLLPMQHKHTRIQGKNKMS